MKWITLLLALPPLQDASTDLRSEDVRFPAGALELAGELLLPPVEWELPAAVVLQGSGKSDRTNGWSAAIARTLAEQGLVVLLTDKRGCGQSAGDWRQAGIEDLAEDALAAVRYLQGRQEVDGDRIGLVGLSQGGWVAPVAAARSRDVAFVIDVSGAATSFAEQVLHEMRNTTREAGLDAAAEEVVAGLNVACARFALNSEWEPYSRAREAGLATAARQVVAGFPERSDDPTWSFLRRVMTFDPLPYWTVVEQPTLVLYGEDDEHENVPVAESVRRLEFAFALSGKQNATITVIPGAGHAFLADGALLPAFVEALADWVE